MLYGHKSSTAGIKDARLSGRPRGPSPMTRCLGQLEFAINLADHMETRDRTIQIHVALIWQAPASHLSESSMGPGELNSMYPQLTQFDLTQLSMPNHTLSRWYKTQYHPSIQYPGTSGYSFPCGYNSHAEYRRAQKRF